MAKKRKLNVAEFLRQLEISLEESKKISQRIKERLDRLKNEVEQKEEEAKSNSRVYDPDNDWF